MEVSMHYRSTTDSSTQGTAERQHYRVASQRTPEIKWNKCAEQAAQELKYTRINKQGSTHCVIREKTPSSETGIIAGRQA